jgi:hypothetical protein
MIVIDKMSGNTLSKFNITYVDDNTNKSSWTITEDKIPITKNRVDVYYRELSFSDGTKSKNDFLILNSEPKTYNLKHHYVSDSGITVSNPYNVSYTLEDDILTINPNVEGIFTLRLTNNEDLSESIELTLRVAEYDELFYIESYNNYKIKNFKKIIHKGFILNIVSFLNNEAVRFEIESFVSPISGMTIENSIKTDNYSYIEFISDEQWLDEIGEYASFRLVNTEGSIINISFKSTVNINVGFFMYDDTQDILNGLFKYTPCDLPMDIHYYTYDMGASNFIITSEDDLNPPYTKDVDTISKGEYYGKITVTGLTNTIYLSIADEDIPGDESYLTDLVRIVGGFINIYQIEKNNKIIPISNDFTIESSINTIEFYIETNKLSNDDNTSGYTIECSPFFTKHFDQSIEYDLKNYTQKRWLSFDVTDFSSYRSGFIDFKKGDCLISGFTITQVPDPSYTFIAEDDFTDLTKTSTFFLTPNLNNDFAKDISFNANETGQKSITFTAPTLLSCMFSFRSYRSGRNKAMDVEVKAIFLDNTNEIINFSTSGYIAIGDGLTITEDISFQTQKIIKAYEIKIIGRNI